MPIPGWKEKEDTYYYANKPTEQGIYTTSIPYLVTTETFSIDVDLRSNPANLPLVDIV